MYVHGAIAAIVGEPSKPVLVSHFTKKQKGHDEELVTLHDKSSTQKLNLNDTEACKMAFKNFITTLYKVIELQNHEVNKSIPVIIGIDGRQKYPVLSTVIPSMFTAIKELVEEGKIELDKLLSNITLKIGSYGRGVPTPNGTIQELNDDENANLIIRQNSSGRCLEANQFLESIKTKILTGDAESIQKAANLAYEIGYNKGVQFKVTRDADERFVMSVKYHPKIENIPLLNFLSWHPSIKKAFRDGHAQGRESKMQVVVQTISDVKDRKTVPFIDILSCYIQDVFDDIPNLESRNNQEIIDFFVTLCREFVRDAYSDAAKFIKDKVRVIAD